MRTPHVLKSTNGDDRPNNVVFFDTETTPETISKDVTKQNLILGFVSQTRTTPKGYLVNQNNLFFTDNNTFWDKIETWARPKINMHLIAHNLVFDLVVTDGFIQLAQRGWELASFYSRGMTSIFKWHKDNCKITALDNSNFFQGTLASWGDRIGIPKLEIDFETCTSVELAIYNRRDVDIMVKLWRTWYQFLDENDCGNFKVTVPSTAFNTWRYRFLKHKVYIHDNSKVIDLEREAYKGGRVEVFYQGKVSDDKFYYLDVNNLYGYILKENQFPINLINYADNPSLDLVKRKLDKYLVIADVTINIDDNPFPYKVNNRTAYPKGRFRTVLTTEELQLAINNNWLVKTHSIASYYKGYLFKEYIDYFYKLRQDYINKGMLDYANLCKLFVNSLYGKFGQKALDQTIIGEADINIIRNEVVFNIDTGKRWRQITISGKVYKEVAEGESYNSFPAIAAHVTAYARLHMYRLLKTVSKGNAYYMDTDSIIVNSQGYKELSEYIDKNQLGMLKVEQQSAWLEINAPKDYAMDNRKRIKGISRTAEMVTPTRYKQNQWIRFQGLISRGNLSEYIIKSITKNLYREITSGNVTSSGWIEPYFL